MARYIDADRFKNNLEKAMEKMHLIGGVKGVDVGAVITALDRQPTADVVPKSEVDKLKIEIEALKIANEKMYAAYKAQAMEIFEELEKSGYMHLYRYGLTLTYENFCNYLAELKKKYTGDQT